MDGLFDQNSVSKIGLGTWQLGLRGWGVGYEEKQLIEGLKSGIKNGLNFIDSAELYGNGRSESLVGAAIKEFDRRDYFVATKLAGFNATARRVKRSLTNSLSRLKLDYIDLYQVHWEPSVYTNIPELFRELERVANEGLVNHIGVSNFSSQSIERANSSMREMRVESNQVKFNAVERPSPKLLDFMKSNGIKLIAWSPLAQGFLSGKYSIGNRPSGTVRKFNRLFSTSNFERFQPLLTELRRIADERKVTPVQIVLAYEKYLGVLPIPGFKNIEQVIDLISADSLKMSEEDISSLDLSLRKSVPLVTSGGLYPRFLPNFIARLGMLFV